jgi:2,5-furandicarboxylate decarboxylase 1
VDIYDSDALEWALATRFQAHRDAVILPDQPSSSLDPSADHTRGKKALTTKVGLDATIPEGVDPAHYERVRYKDIDLADYR